MLEPSAAASGGPFAPTQLYILLGITIATLGWLWPKEKAGADVTTVRVMACGALVLGEVLHVIINHLHLIVSVTEISETTNVSVHVILLSFYATVTGAMLYSAQRARQRRISVPPTSDEADPRGNQVD